METLPHTRRRTISEKQERDFVANLEAAHHAHGTEKAVEQAINTLLVEGLRSLHPESPTTHDYRRSTDGYILIGTSAELETPYAVLVEAKRDLDLSGNKRDVAAVLAQACHYLRTLRDAGDVVPSVTVVCDTDEVFAVPTTTLAPHMAGDYRWDEFSASTMYKDSALLAALISDSNIRPYVHDVAVGFDASMFVRAVDSMARGVEPVRVPVSTESLERVFTRFKLEVLGGDASGLKNKDEIALFIDVLRGSDEVFAHPKKPNALVWGKKTVTLDTYRFEWFWSQYVTGEYTLDQVKSLTEMGDVLIEENDRRFSGDFWTPPIWVDKSHEYIEAALGEGWKNEYVVWDSSWGSGNLTRDYKFSNLFASTLFQEELDIAAEYNPEAVKFQYDFLNDDMVLHEEGMTGEKALEMARAGKLKMPLALVEAMAENKPIVFYGNPPYGQASDARGGNSKEGIGKTTIREHMSGLNMAARELYTQFIYRVQLLARTFNYTSDFHFFFFNKGFLTSPSFGKFTKELVSEFSFKDGFMMNAGEFSGTSAAWGIIFSHFEIGGTNQSEFTYDVLMSDKDMSITKMCDWTARLAPTFKDTINSWVAEKTEGEKATEGEFPRTTDGIAPPVKTTPSGKFVKDSIGFAVLDVSTIQADRYLSVYSMCPYSAHKGKSITPDNLTRAAVTFSIRRSVQEVIAEQKLLWVRDKDIFTRPPESLLTGEFITDCMIYSLFDRQSNQTSLRNYEYQGRTYRVVNEFFPYSTTDMLDLAQQHRNRTIEGDLTGEDERFAHTWIKNHRDNLSSEAAAVLDMAWEIIQDSFTKRATHAAVAPRYQVETWDAGWKQIAAMVFGRERVDNDIYNSYYKDWRNNVRDLGNKIAHAAMEAGVI